MKKVISVFSAFVMFWCCPVASVNAWDSTSYISNEAIVNESELIPLNVNDALTNGLYSDDGRFLLYDDSLFVVEDLERAQADLMELFAAPYAASAESYTYGRYKYTHFTSGLFYSRGDHHVLGRVSLNPGQTGRLGLGATFGMHFDMACGNESNGVSIGFDAGYQEEYTVTVELDVNNPENVVKTAVLNRVYMVHEYKTYDLGFWLNQNEYLGISQIYEPYSVYTYLE